METAIQTINSSNHLLTRRLNCSEGTKHHTMKVTHIITSLGSGGAEAMLFKLLRAGRDVSMFEHSVICLTDDGFYGQALRSLGVNLYSLGMKRGKLRTGDILRLYHFLQKERPVILLSWLYHADLLGLLVGKLLGIQNVVWNIRTSNMDFKVYNGSVKYVFQALRNLSRFPTAVIFNSRVGYEHHVRQGFRPKRWLYIPNGFDTDLFRPSPQARVDLRRSLGLPDDALLIGMVARYDPVKGHDFFLKAAQMIRSRIPKLHFVLVGRDQGRELQSRIGNSDLRGYVHLLGERHDIAAINAALDVATLTSSFGEGFPNVIGEAMSCGIPCVVTDVGDSAHVVDDTGMVVPPNDPMAISNAWEVLLTMEANQRKQMGERARRRIQQFFSLPVIVNQYEKLFKELAIR